MNTKSIEKVVKKATPPTKQEINITMFILILLLTLNNDVDDLPSELIATTVKLAVATCIEDGAYKITI